MVQEVEENNPSQMRNPAFSGVPFHHRGTEAEVKVHKFYKYLYWDENIPEKKRNRIKWRLKVSKRDIPCYVLTLCEGEDQLEIYNSAVLLQSYFRKNPKFIIGIAGGYGAAVGMVQQITEECYRKNKDADLKRYLAERTE